MEDRVIAFAGSGETSLKNATDLLNDWITDDVEVSGFFIPTEISQRKQPGLANVVSYLTKEWGGDDGDEDPFDTEPADKLVDALLDSTTKDRYLVVILGDEVPDETTADLIRQARDNDITVLDLAAGRDEYTAELPGDEEPAEEPPAEPEEPAERPKRRQRRTAAPEPEEPAEEPSEPRKTRGRPRTKAENEERAQKTLDGLKAQREAAAARQDPDKTVGHPEIDPPFEKPYTVAGSPEEKPFDFSKLQKADSGALSLPDGTTTEQVKGLLIVALEGALAALKGGLGRPQEETFAYIVDEYGNVVKKRGRGKPARDEKVEFLTKSEAAARGFSEES